MKHTTILWMKYLAAVAFLLFLIWASDYQTATAIISIVGVLVLTYFFIKFYGADQEVKEARNNLDALDFISEHMVDNVDALTDEGWDMLARAETRLTEQFEKTTSKW